MNKKSYIKFLMGSGVHSASKALARLTFGDGTTLDILDYDQNYKLSADEAKTAVLSSGKNLADCAHLKILPIAESIDRITFRKIEQSNWTLTDGIDFTNANKLEIIGDSSFRDLKTINMGREQNLSIPETVKDIGLHAFAGWTSWEGGLEFNNNLLLTKFNGGAFTGWEKANRGIDENIVIPKNVVEIGGYCFENWKAWEGGIVLNNNIRILSHSAFSGWENASMGINVPLVLPETIGAINQALCYNWRSWEGGLDFGNNTTLKNIYDHAFSNWQKATMGKYQELTIPATVEKIDLRSFQNWYSWEGGLNFDDNMKILEIGSSAFEEWRKATMGTNMDLNIPSNINLLGKNAFAGWRSWEGGLNFGNNTALTSIPSGAFSSWSTANKGQKVDLVIPTRVNEILGFGHNNSWHQGAFSDWNSWEGSVILPEGLTTIGEIAFLNWSSANKGVDANLIIPSTVSSIGTEAFYGWVSWKGGVEFKSILPPTLTGYSTFSNWNNETGILGQDLAIPRLVVPDGADYSLWKAAFPWNHGKFVMICNPGETNCVLWHDIPDL